MPTTDTLRGLVVIRLSKVTDASTSPERQLAACRDLIRQRGWTEAGIAEDLDVSAGKTSPFTRPKLGDWLTNRVGEFDVLVVYRMDRLVRRLLDLSDMLRWCQEHHVKLVSATEAFLDLTAPFGDIIALLVAKVAEMELAAISERNASAARHNLKAGKYRGGIPPWGYLPEQINGEWRFVPDPVQVDVIHEVARRVLDGEPLRGIAHDLTARGVLTPKDRFAQHQGRKIEGYAWHSGPLKRSLTSATLVGHAVSAGTSIRSDDGSPVVRAEPIITREVFDRLAVELADRENRKEPTKRSTSLLVGIIFCGACGRPAYRLKGGPGRSPRYRCASAQYKTTCENPSNSIALDYADRVVERTVLALLGKSERLERIWDPGSDRSAELAEVSATLEDLTDQLGSGVFRRGTPQRARLDERIANLERERTRLASEATQPAGWNWHPTGELFRDWWASQDVPSQNVWLRTMGVKLTWRGDQVHLDLGDVVTLTEQLRASGPVADWQNVLSQMEASGIAGVEVASSGVVTVHQSE